MHASEAVRAEESRWNAFVASSPVRSFLQTWAWGEVQQNMGVPYWRIVVEDKGKIVAVALVIERSLKLGYSWLYVPRGPIFAENLSESDTEAVWKALEEKLQNLAEERNSFFIRMDPALPTGALAKAGWRKSSREVQPQHTLLLDLAKEEDALLAQMRPKMRYNIRLAEKKGVQVRFSSDPKDVDIFLALCDGVTKRTGFSYHPDNYYLSIIETLGSKGMAELAIAEVDGKAVAAHFMIYADGITTYAHGASDHNHRDTMAPTLLYWKTILRAKEKGMHTYDFFGVAPEDADDSHPWAGITRMKTGFGGTRASYCGAYDFVLNEALYTMFNLTRTARGILKSSFV